MSTKLLIPKELASQMLTSYPQKGDSRGKELLASAVLRCAARISDPVKFTIDVKLDYREIDVALAQTVGALTRIQPLPTETAIDKESPALMASVGKALRGLCPNGPDEARFDPDRHSTTHAVLLNLEYFREGPWLGGDDWIPEGFILNEAGPSEG